MPNERPEEEFSPEIRAVFDAYSAPRPSTGFDARFWAQLDARQNRYRGLSGWLRRVWELEIEGVLVWRLALATFSGGASCALILGLALGFSTPQSAPLLPVPLPDPELPPTTMRAFAWYRREGEDPFFRPYQPPSAPPRAPRHGSDFSWNGSNARLA